MMKSGSKLYSLLLLPKRFNAVGIVLVILMGLVLIFMTNYKFFARKFLFSSAYYHEYYKSIAKFGIALGLFFVAAAKEKIEDEMISKIRLESFHLALIAIIMAILVNEAVYFFVDKLYISAAELVYFQLAVYILWFKFKKHQNEKYLES